MADISLSRILESRRAFKLSPTQAAMLALCVDNARVDRASMMQALMALGACQTQPAARSFDVQLSRLNKALGECGRIEPSFVPAFRHMRQRAHFYALSFESRVLISARIADANPKRERAA